ncbi:Outer membrane protein assembly factor BamB [Planctomycetales bacterium 10988]|nr:Outer membrane protein assembly factor BamB [Planctomycetales bacterium 10988]
MVPARLFSLLLIPCCLGLLGADWLAFRGPQQQGVAPTEKLPPLTWDGASGKNIAWKTELTGTGLSSPILVGDQVILTACTGEKQDRLHVMSYSQQDGSLQWERSFWATGRTLCHEKTRVAAPTPVSDGKHLFALYSTNDLICLDLAGNLVWFRGLTFDYPNASNSLGMASSLVVHGKTVIAQIENDSQSLALGINTKNGTNRWVVERPRLANWTSPVLMPMKDSKDALVFLQSGEKLSAYVVSSGELAWEYQGDCSTIPSAVLGEKRIFVPLGRGGRPGIIALPLPSSEAVPGDISQTAFVNEEWHQARLAASTASPLYYEGMVLTINSAGVLNCADAETGEIIWRGRVRGPYSGTPVIVSGHLFAINEDGEGKVVKLSKEEGEVLETNQLGETILCTPAVADGAIYVRSDQHLWKIAN